MNKQIRHFLYFVIVSVLTTGVFSAAQAINATSEQSLRGSLIKKNDSEDIDLQPPARDNTLPNVLLYGDSITGHYYPYAEKALKGKVNLYHMPPHKDWDSSNLIPYMTDLKKAMERKDGVKWNVIHFNFGLHDMKRYNDAGKKDRKHGTMQVSYADYATNLEASIRWLQTYAPDAQLIFAITTPVPEGEPRRRSSDSIKLNEIARNVIANFPSVLFNDLYNFTLPHHLQWKRGPHDVHYNETGKKAQGEKVAKAILQTLENRKL